MKSAKWWFWNGSLVALAAAGAYVFAMPLALLLVLGMRWSDD